MSSVEGKTVVRPLVSRAALLEKLEREMYETESGYDAVELVSRRSWNARSRELITWLTQNEGG